MRSRIPIVGWLAFYDRTWLRPDLVAGATVWAVLIPSALAYAVIVGVEPIVGLYTVPLALVGYAMFGGSRLHVGRMGWVADLVPDPVLKGFIQGGDHRLPHLASTIDEAVAGYERRS